MSNSNVLPFKKTSRLESLKKVLAEEGLYHSDLLDSGYDNIDAKYIIVFLDEPELNEEDDAIVDNLTPTLLVTEVKGYGYHVSLNLQSIAYGKGADFSKEEALALINVRYNDIKDAKTLQIDEVNYKIFKVKVVESEDTINLNMQLTLPMSMNINLKVADLALAIKNSTIFKIA